MMINPHEVCWVGIDVAKATLDVYQSLPERAWSVANDAEGRAALATSLPAAHPALIVLEATGGLERALVAEWLVAGRPVAVVNPRQVRRFAQALGYWASPFKVI